MITSQSTLPAPEHDPVRAYIDGTHTQADVEAMLAAFAPLISKYITVLLGKFHTESGKNYLSDTNVRIFALSFRRGGNVLKTLQWVVAQCRRFSQDEIHLTVVEVFLDCMRRPERLHVFASELAKSLSVLIGNPMEILAADVSEYAKFGKAPDPQRAAETFTLVEEMFAERGIVLTGNERALLRALRDQLDEPETKELNLRAAARSLGLNRMYAHRLFHHLCEKARLVDLPSDPAYDTMAPLEK